MSEVPNLETELNDLESEFHPSEDAVPDIDELETLEVPQNPPQKQSIVYTIFNLLNSLLGAGILSIPNSFCNTGIIPSILLMAFMVFISWIGSIMVIYLLESKSVENFSELTVLVLGGIGSKIYSFLSVLFIFSCQVVYLIVGSSCIISWFELGNIHLDSLWPRAGVTALYSLCIPIALTIPRNNKFLSYFSTVTFIMVLFFCGSLIYKSIDFIVKNKGINGSCILWKFDMSLFSSLSVYSLSFALPCVCSPILANYTSDTSRRRNVTLYAIIICFFISMLPGLFAYLQFGAITKENILDSYDNKDVLMIIVKGVFFFIVSSAYPLVSQSSLNGYSQLIFGEGNAKEITTKRRIIVLVLNNGIPLVIAMFLTNIKPILGVGGAIGGCLSNFVFPGIMWVKSSEESKLHWKNILVMIYVLFGIAVGALSTYTAVMDAIKSF